MRDRTLDLQQAPSTSEATIVQIVEHPAAAKKEKKSKKQNDLEAGGNGSDAAAMTMFFEEISNIRDSVAVIKQSIESIESLHQQALAVTSEQESAEKAEDLKRLMERTTKKSVEVRNKLKALDTETKKIVKDPKRMDESRIRINQQGSLTKRFLDIMKEYKDMQKRYQDKYKQVVERQFLIVKPSATPDEIQEVVNSGQGATVFAQQVSGTHVNEAKRALLDIHKRHAEVQRLEESILELHQLFADMQLMVEAQGEMLDQIEKQMSRVVATTDESVTALIDANKHQKSARKKMKKIVAVVAVLLIVVIVCGITFGRH